MVQAMLECLESSPWRRYTAAEKTEKVRHLLEIEGLTYSAAAKVLGCNRMSVAGVVERTTRTDNPIRTVSKGRPKSEGGRKPRPRKPRPDRVVQLPILLPPIPPAEKTTIFGGATWRAIEGIEPIDMLRINEHTCRWPLGNGAPFLFCGQHTRENSVYCPHHARIAYRDPATIKKIKA